MKATKKNCLVVCENMNGKKKTYESVEKKGSEGFAICPACGEYHPVVKED